MEKKSCEKIDSIKARSVLGNTSSDDLKRIEEVKLLSDSDIQADKAKVFSRIRTRIPAEVLKLRSQLYFYKIAAALAFPIALAVAWTFFCCLQEKTSSQLCEISAPRGSVSKCILPDGSRVWVNTNSSISYDVATFNQKDRKIEINGEAYFEVCKNKEKPFIVSNALAHIVVTGTAFNVRSYPETKQFETVLTRGSIEFHTGQKEDMTIELKPGERAVFDAVSKNTVVDQVNAQLFSSWLNGQLVFKDATLNDIVLELQRIYNIEFLYKDKGLGDFRFRGMFSYSNNLIDALEKLKKTASIDYYIENKVVWLKKI